MILDGNRAAAVALVAELMHLIDRLAAGAFEGPEANPNQRIQREAFPIDYADTRRRRRFWARPSKKIFRSQRAACPAA